MVKSAGRFRLYRVDAGADFLLRSGRRIVEQGHCQIVRLGSHELVLDAEPNIAAGMDIEMNVPWPGAELALVLQLRGRTVRKDGHHMIVRIARYQFKTAAKRLPEPPVKRAQAAAPPGISPLAS